MEIGTDPASWVLPPGPKPSESHFAAPLQEAAGEQEAAVKAAAVRALQALESESLHQEGGLGTQLPSLASKGLEPHVPQDQAGHMHEGGTQQNYPRLGCSSTCS